MKGKSLLTLLLLVLVLTSCTGGPLPVTDGVVRTPDYDGAVVPFNIAPLNFCLDGAEYARARVEVRGRSGSITVRALSLIHI